MRLAVDSSESMKVALEVILGPPELLGVTPSLLEPADLLEHRPEHLAEVRRLRSRVDVEDAGVAVALGAGVHRVHQRLPLAHLLEERDDMLPPMTSLRR